MTDDTIDPSFELEVGVNTYILRYDDDSENDATTYFWSRPHSAVWKNASANDQENALRQATALIDTLDFQGRKASSDQALAWPRAGVRDRNRCPVPAGTIPQGVLDATCEYAIAILANDQSKPQQILTHKQVGDLQLDFAATLPDTLPPLVRAFLQPYLRTSSPNVATIIP